MTDARTVLTDRLELRAVDPATDLAGLFPIFNDPASWEHAPDYRHLDEQTTAEWLRRCAEGWETGGLGYWTVRLRDRGQIVGCGGAGRRFDGSWNLLWRIDVAQRGQGLATTVGRAAIDAANIVDPGAAVIAWIRANNPASRVVASRLGLIEHEQRVDDSDGVTRIPYADRALNPGSG